MCRLADYFTAVGFCIFHFLAIRFLGIWDLKCLTSHVTFVISTFDLFEMDRENKTKAAKRKERPWPLAPPPTLVSQLSSGLTSI